MKKPNRTPQTQKPFTALGDRMKKLRLERGHTSLEKFALDNDLSRVLYSNYESGKGNITYKNLVKILAALEISFKDFFSEGFE